MADNETPKFSGIDYGFISNLDGTSGDKISCFPSNTERCIVIRNPAPVGVQISFYNPSRESEFHTAAIREATTEINAILQKVAEKKRVKPKGTSLHHLNTDGGPIVAWVASQVDVIGTKI